MKHRKLFSFLTLCLVFIVAGCNYEYPHYAWDDSVCSTYWEIYDEDGNVVGINYFSWDFVCENSDYILDVRIVEMSEEGQTAHDPGYKASNGEGDTKDGWYYYTPYAFILEDGEEDIIKMGPYEIEPMKNTDGSDAMYTDEETGEEYPEYLAFLWGLSYSEPGYCYSNGEKVFVGAKYRICFDYVFNLQYYSDYGEITTSPDPIFLTSYHGSCIRLIENDANGDDVINKWLSDEETSVSEPDETEPGPEIDDPSDETSEGYSEEDPE